MWHERFYVSFEIRGHPLQTANGNRFLFHPYAPAGRFAGPVAGASQHAGKYVGFPIDHVRLGVPFGGDETDVLRNRCMRRTSVLTVNDFVEIFRVFYVGRFHKSQ